MLRQGVALDGVVSRILVRNAHERRLGEHPRPADLDRIRHHEGVGDAHALALGQIVEHVGEERVGAKDDLRAIALQQIPQLTRAVADDRPGHLPTPVCRIRLSVGDTPEPRGAADAEMVKALGESEEAGMRQLADIRRARLPTQLGETFRESPRSGVMPLTVADTQQQGPPIHIAIP